MTALEAHIQVLQGVQKVAGYQENMFKKEEIDLHLSRNQRRLLTEILDKKFDDVQSARDMIRPLYIKNYKLPTYVPLVTEQVHEDYAVYGVFPGNYQHLISSRSKIITSSDAKYCADVSALKVAGLYQVATEKTGVITIPASTGTVAPYFHKATVSLTISGTNVVALKVPEGLLINSSKSNFYLINYILEYFKYIDVQVYFDTYRDQTAPGSLIFVTSNANITAVTISFLKADGTSDASVTVNLISSTYQKYASITKTNFPGFTVSYADNLDQEIDELYAQNINSFYKSKPTNPKSVVSGNLLIAYESKTFIISELVIDYVRMPKQVSINLSQGIELAGNGPQIVVDRTVEYLKLAIENPTYQAVLNDNQIRNPV